MELSVTWTGPSCSFNAPCGHELWVLWVCSILVTFKGIFHFKYWSVMNITLLGHVSISWSSWVSGDGRGSKCKVNLNRHAPLDMSHTRALSFMSLFKPGAQYIGEGHANGVPLHMKSSTALTLKVWDSSPTQDSQVSPVPAQDRTDLSPWGLGSAGFSLLQF